MLSSVVALNLAESRLNLKDDDEEDKLSSFVDASVTLLGSGHVHPILNKWSLTEIKCLKSK